MGKYPIFMDWKYWTLKCPYYPKQSTVSIQLLSKFKWHFPQKQEKNPKICMEPQKITNSQTVLRMNKGEHIMQISNYFTKLY